MCLGPLHNGLGLGGTDTVTLVVGFFGCLVSDVQTLNRSPNIMEIKTETTIKNRTNREFSFALFGLVIRFGKKYAHFYVAGC